MKKSEKMEKGEEEGEPNWSEKVEDLVEAGDTDQAITLLETVVSKLETLSLTQVVHLPLATALTDLATLYNSKGFSLKADALLSRAALIKSNPIQRNDSENLIWLSRGVASVRNDSECGGSLTDGYLEKSTKPVGDVSSCNGTSDDDWEVIADRAPDELLSSQCLPGLSNLSLEDTKVQAPKRRGRGTFSYNKNEMYSDRKSDKSIVDDVEDEDVCHNSEGTIQLSHSKYGTRHVLVLADFSPRTRTVDLEKFFKDFTDRGVAIRWVNDTTALAVFPTPSIALEALNHVRCPFTVRILDEDDVLLGSISTRDLEPSRQRPKTSARTAQRLIAQGVGLKLPSTFGSRDLKNQEEARRNRIVTRQKLRDDAWGADDVN